MARHVIKTSKRTSLCGGKRFVVDQSNDLFMHYVLPWEQCRLNVLENWVLRRIFEPKRDEITGEWRKLRNEKFNDLYFSTNIVQVIKSR
jgi:hypothetical protein